MKDNGLSYKEIRNKYGAKYGKNSVFIDFYACTLSPVFTKAALKLKLIPNTVTIGMIMSGIFGVILFWIPRIHFKIIGTVFIHLWFILDCSDGEVARATKHFSNYGEELDYMAHTINHPLFVLSFLVAFILDHEPDLIVIIAFIIVLAADVAMRMVYIMFHIDEIKSGKKHNNREEKSKFSIKDMAIFFVNIFSQFPNFALLYPIIYMLNSDIAKIYLYVDAVIASTYCYYLVTKWIRKIHKQ